MAQAYILNLLILIGIQLILATSLQLAIGFTGLLNLGHIAFYGIGAYTSALLALSGVPFIWSLLAGGVLAMIAGFILSIPSQRLEGDYLALATLGFAFLVHSVLLNWTSLTRGPLGLPGIPKPEILGVSFSSNLMYFVLTAAIATLSYYTIYRMVNSPFGNLLEAIRDDELAAKTLGKNTFRAKAISMGVSAFFAGIAGSLFAHYLSFISPSSFSLLPLIPVLTIVVIGGLASMKGTLIATVIIVLLPEPLRFIGFPSSVVGPARRMLYALILILILIYKPQGFFGRGELE